MTFRTSRERCDCYRNGGSSPSIFQSKHLLLVGGFYSHPFERYAQVTIGIIFPQGKGVKITKSLSCYHPNIKLNKSILPPEFPISLLLRVFSNKTSTGITPWWCTGTTATARRAQSGIHSETHEAPEPARRGSLSKHRILMVQNPARKPVEGTVVYPIIYTVLYIPGGCLGFLNHQQYQAWSKGEIELVQPGKINGWNIIPWRFGSDHFPF